MVIKHFSHKHALSPYEIEEEKYITCSICDQEMVPNSPAYTCKKPSSSCDFHIHKNCYELPREIQHASHPQHPLTLLPEPPSSFYNCRACAGFCFSFVYSCAACEFAIHVQCSSLAESVQREDHQHPLHLAFSLGPECKEDDEVDEDDDEEEIDTKCRVCSFYVLEGRWAYLCKECGHVTHLECVNAEAELFEKEEEEELNHESEEEEVKEDQEEEEEKSRDSGGEEGEELKEEGEELKEEQEEENEGDELDVIARNQERIIMQQTMFNNQMHLMRMRMHRQVINDSTKRLFQFGL